MPAVADQLDSIKRAHRALYERFVWKSDKDVYDKPERWGRLEKRGDKLVGDCDSFAMELDALTNNLVPIQFRRFAVCRVERRSASYDHCVLVFIVGDDIWVSDCNNAHLVKRDDLPYDMWAWSKGAINEPWETF